MIIKPVPAQMFYAAAKGGQFNGADTTGAILNLTVSATNPYKGTCSFWFKQDSLGGTLMHFRTSAGTSEDTFLAVQAGTLQFFLEKAGSTTRRVWVAAFDENTVIDGDWHHCIAAWDHDTDKCQVYIDDVAIAMGSSTTVITTAPDASDRFSIGGSTPLVDRYEGSLAEYWLVTNASLDISVKTNRRKFISATRRPMYLGANGNRPIGSQPIIYLKGVSTAFNVNSGSAGNFTNGGSALTTPETSPSFSNLPEREYLQFNGKYLISSDGKLVVNN